MHWTFKWGTVETWTLLSFPSDLISEKKEFLALINGCHECEILPTPEVDLFIRLREKAESVVCAARKPNTCAKTLDNSAGKSV